MKAESESYRFSAIQRIIKRIEAKEIEELDYETLKEDILFEYNVINNLDKFLSEPDLSVCNRFLSESDEMSDKVFTRDIFSKD